MARSANNTQAYRDKISSIKSSPSEESLNGPSEDALVRQKVRIEQVKGMNNLLKLSTPILTAILGVAGYQGSGPLVKFATEKLGPQVVSLLSKESPLEALNLKVLLRKLYFEGDNPLAKQIRPILEKVAAAANINPNTLTHLFTAELPDEYKLKFWESLNSLLDSDGAPGVADAIGKGIEANDGDSLSVGGAQNLIAGVLGKLNGAAKAEAKAEADAQHTPAQEDNEKASPSP